MLRALAEHLGTSPEQVITIADERRRDRGGFTSRIWLDYVE
ncbi:MAG TPA: hypothetical protein VF317_01285 [Dermatophilaceae bacterium]